MKIGLYQFEVVQNEREENLRRIGDGARGLDVELLVLPELCTSGYLLSPEQARQHAIQLPGDGVRPFVCLAESLGAWVVAGVIEEDGAHLYNTTLIVGPQGWVGRQRKVHLTRLERGLFTPGAELQPFALGAATIGVVTCFDAWFPEVSRQLTRSGAQLLCQPAAFGGPRTLEVMRVRSMENHVFSITANRLGREARGGLTVEFRGESQIVDCNGDVLLSAGNEERALVADVDLSLADSKANVMCADISEEWSRYYSASS